MRKTVGTIFLILSVFLIASGAVLITQANAYKNTVDGNMRYELSSSFSAKTKAKNLGGWALIIAGAGFFCSGIWKMSRKSEAEKQREAEYLLLKKRYKNDTGAETLVS